MLDLFSGDKFSSGTQIYSSLIQDSQGSSARGSGNQPKGRYVTFICLKKCSAFLPSLLSFVSQK